MEQLLGVEMGRVSVMHCDIEYAYVLKPLQVTVVSV